MMLAHPFLSKPICFEENRISILVIENPGSFTDLLTELLMQINGDEGDFFLSEDYKPASISKNISLIIDPLHIDFGQKKIIGKIYADIETISANAEMFERTADTKSQLAVYIESLISTASLPLAINAEISVGALLKAADVGVDLTATMLIERISEYMHVLAELSLANCFVFVNLKSYLSEEALRTLYKEIAYKKYHVLLIENYFRDTLRMHEKTVVIDSDLCEVINEN